MSIKNHLISLGYIFSIIVLASIVISILNYFDIIMGNNLQIIKLAIAIIATFIGGFILGIKSIKKGYLEGIKLASIYLIIIFLLSILGFDNKINLNNLFYYLIIILSTMFGSMLGINKKNPSNDGLH